MKSLADSIAEFELFNSPRKLQSSNHRDERVTLYDKETYASDKDIDEEENHE